MKIGVFDSGLGGLLVLNGLVMSKKLKQYDFIYLGDTKNLPYGNKSSKQIYSLATKAVEYLFEQDCELIIVACNTVSAEALRKLQQEYLPKSKYKNRKILGIIRPTIETVSYNSIVGLIGTNLTTKSGAYVRELKKINPKIKTYQLATPLLVPMIENESLNDINEVLGHYLRPLIAKGIDTLVLGCTHYGLIKKQIKAALPKGIKIIAQEELLPAKLINYLKGHPEIDKALSKNAKIELQVTKNNPLYTKLAHEWFGKSAKLKVVNY
jgi:glutamate racemase